eukprot:1158452-Pelagomonas_calceolata.AAC.7
MHVTCPVWHLSRPHPCNNVLVASVTFPLCAGGACRPKACDKGEETHIRKRRGDAHAGIAHAALPHSQECMEAHSLQARFAAAIRGDFSSLQDLTCNSSEGRMWSHCQACAVALPRQNVVAHCAAPVQFACLGMAENEEQQRAMHLCTTKPVACSTA